MLSTAGFTCVAFVTGALAWWGPKFIHSGMKLQPGNEDVTINEYVSKLISYYSYIECNIMKYIKYTFFYRHLFWSCKIVRINFANYYQYLSSFNTNAVIHQTVTHL